ncbi:protein translocase subunit SecD [Tessaracoccus sp. OS52]|uniref:protein translocase subunit SecD n=1 Tax=Tessaracoccus sp. OS52 TaxID=2886691 RepID=UPI001D105F81|nr:protein translocase subunit SecD [Tessaracoccus sp. OS52]MCC2592994.1 protein translocase subunit SecD [Tessaracoccus sp. OS52]
MYTLMAATSTWAPKLGLDLQGGMTITLTATNQSVPAQSLETAKNIMQQRVDGLGVGEASVATSGDRNIIVSAPNVQRDDLVELVGATAQLAFRPVLAVAQATGAAPPAEEEGPGLPTAPPDPATEGEGERLEMSEVLSYTPSGEDTAAFNAYECGAETPDKLDQPLFACDSSMTQKYLLGPVAIAGEQVTDASSGIPPQDVQYVVTLDFNDEGARQMSELTGALLPKSEPLNMFAIVLDGVVESAATTNAHITNGEAMISGNFTADSAAALANVLKFGSLPLSFEPSQVENVSPTLGGEQLQVGLLAGLVGLIIVLLYCFVYYRGLGIVVLGSLAVAAIATYASMVLLGQAVGFSLSLPAIAGAIVAIGVTADSFVIYFERIRDEIREGRSLRSAIQTGWVKARSTIIVSDLVQLLSATVLFLLAVGGVQGFAFALGLTTLIDLAVCFFFTKPLVSLLGRTKFFGEGHPLSGLDAAHMGVTRDSLLGRRIRRTNVLKEA